MMSLERNIVADRILHAIDHGKLPPAQTESRLHALIDREIDRTDMPADAALIDGCLALLEQLHTPVEAPDTPRRSARGFVSVCKWAAVAAALIFLVLGLTDNLRWQWFEHGTSEDGEQHIITGHEVEVDVIQEAIAEHRDVEQNLQFTTVAEMERSLGINPGIPARLADTYEADNIDVVFLSDQISFFVTYRSAAAPDSPLSLTVNCCVSLNNMSVSSQESEVGEIYLIGGCCVYVSRSIDHEIAQWMYGNSCFVLSVPGSAASATECAREIIDGSFAPDSGTDVTAEQIAASIQQNITHAAEQLKTDDFGELCDYLGFVPDFIRPEAIGADSVIFTGNTLRTFLQVDVCYRDADGATMTLFDSTYYSSLEEASYTFEESEVGEFFRIGNRSVYSTMNYSWRVYSWTEGMRFCSISTKMAHDDAVALLEEYFAGNVIAREEKSLLIGVTAEEIAASIQQNITHAAEQLETDDFGELCEYLGFVPDLIQPEAIGADSVLFIGTTAPIYLLVDVIYRDADGNTLTLFTCTYYSSMANVQYTFEESEEGEFIRIGNRSVYSTMNYSWRVYSWTEGLNVCCISTQMAHDDAVAMLEEYFAGNVIVREEKSPSTGVTAEQIAASIQRHMTYDTQPLQTEDFGALCEYLGFVPDLIQPEAIGADSVYFSASTTPAFLRVVIHYRDADENTMIHFSGAYYSSMEDAIFAFEESEEGEFIQIGDRSVYTTMNFSWRVYSWTEDLSICYISTQLEHDDAVAMLEEYFAGNVIVREEKPPLTGVTAEEIRQCIDRNQVQMRRTADFGEVCDFLGFTPMLIHPDAVNAASVDFTAMTSPDLVRLDVSYIGADGVPLGMLSNLYFPDPENAYFTFEQSEEGQYIRIGQKDVYRTFNIDEAVFNWTSGSSVCNLYWMQEPDAALSALEDFFSGHVLTREAESTRHGVTAEEIEASTQQSTDQELQYLRTSDYAKICEFLGFTPELIRPEMLEATGIDFSAEILPDNVRLDAYYLNVDGLAKNHFSIYYYTDPDKIPYYVEESETGHFIDVCGQQVYTTLISTQSSYSWRFKNGVCAFYCDAKSTLSLPALEDYLSGHFMTMEAAAQLPTGVTEQQIADAIMRQDQQQLTTDDFQEMCDLLGFVPPIFRPEVFNAEKVMYSADIWSDWISLAVSYQPEDPEYNVLMQIQYFRSVDEVYSNFEQSETGVFLSIAGTTVYCAPNIRRTSYAWVDGTVTYFLSGVLPKETTVPLLEAYLRGDQHTPDTPGI